MTTMAQPQPAAASSMMAQAVCIQLTLSSIGNRRQVNSSSIDTDADKTLLRVSKQLYDCPEYKAIGTLDGEIRRYMYAKALPSPLKSGTYLVPNALLVEVDRRLHDFADERKRLIEDFVTVYPAQIQIAKEKLKSLFDPRDFPHSDVIRAQFQIDWQLFEFGVPGSLEGMNREIFEEQKQKAEARWQETQEEIQLLMRTAAADLVNHMVDRLSGTEDGKPKIFRNSMLDNINEFLSTFNAKNLANDEELAELVSKAKKLTQGIDPETLRKNEAVRDAVLDGFEKIKGSLDTMLIAKPKRKITLD